MMGHLVTSSCRSENEENIVMGHLVSSQIQISILTYQLISAEFRGVSVLLTDLDHTMTVMSS